MSTTTGNLIILSNGIVQGGTATWKYDTVAAAISVTGSANVVIGGVTTTQPFSGSHALPNADFLSVNCVVGQTFILDSYTFYCTNIDTVAHTATYMVSGTNYFGTLILGTAATLPIINSAAITYNYGGAYGTFCFKAA